MQYQNTQGASRSAWQASDSIEWAWLRVRSSTPLASRGGAGGAPEGAPHAEPAREGDVRQAEGLDTRLGFPEGTKGSQGMGVGSNYWFDRVLLSVLCSNPHVDRCSNPLPWDPLSSP